MTGSNATVRDRIVSYAEAAKREGQTYKETAEKLGIGTRTLRRYRRGGSRPSKRIRRKMKRGGKLTQLRQAIGPSGDEIPEVLQANTDELMDRPLFAGQFSAELGAGNLFTMEEVNETVEVTVTARQYRRESGTLVWEIGPEGGLGTVESVEEKTFTVGSNQDQRHLAGEVSAWLAEEGIIDSPEARATARGMRTI
jgi:transcriptional regulator with XRE-family HTH domain